jgi:pseudaminic acid cytidylyltransferase
MNIAIIPARGGSKRIPHKNIKYFLGKPIITYSIETAIKSELFDKVIVSTDSEEIANISKKYGAEVPFMRPKEISDDFSTTIDVLKHAANWCLTNFKDVKYICCIYATAPFLQVNYLKEAYEILINNHASSIFSVTQFSFPIFRAFKIENGKLKMFWPKHETTRSQDLPEAYHDAGQFYWVDFKKFITKPKIYYSDSLPIILPNYLVQDIDTLEDWDIAELKYRIINNHSII